MTPAAQFCCIGSGAANSLPPRPCTRTGEVFVISGPPANRSREKSKGTEFRRLRLSGKASASMKVHATGLARESAQSRSHDPTAQPAI
jgi:hypothetical protein